VIVLLVAAVGLLAVVGVNTLRTQGASSSGPAAGESLPPFAAPLARSAVTGDVNVAREAGQGAAGDRPACSLRGPGILTSCELVRGAPAAIAFFVPGRERCEREVDALARAGRDHPDVRIAAVALGGDRDEVRRIIARRGWTLPVAWDRDAILANLYGVAVCPQITFAEAGGRVRETTVGELGAEALALRLGRLEAAPS
jgi:hypothetical protein